MTQARNGSTVVMNYQYNGRGEQVRKYLGTTNTYSLYDEQGHWLADYSNATTPSQQAIWMGDTPVGVFVGTGTNQKLHYIEADALGTPRVVVDPTRGTNGTAVWNWLLEGEAFGKTAPNQNPDGDATSFVFNLRFPGQRFDSASGLNYNHFRDYEPGTGRYAQSDPIGLAGGVSTYGYVGGNPMTGVDPLGLACVATGNTVRCQYADYPGFSFPRPNGWPDRIDDDEWWYHGHDIPINVGDVDANCVRRELIKQPTPNSGNSPATGRGTPNDATPDSVDTRFTPASPVISYAFVDPTTRNTFIVNVTQPGHRPHSKTIAQSRRWAYARGTDRRMRCKEAFHGGPLSLLIVRSVSKSVSSDLSCFHQRQGSYYETSYQLSRDCHRHHAPVCHTSHVGG
jgi:RHS repeat-associated protein